MLQNFSPELYQGHWFEVGRYPNIWEVGCTGATASYILNSDKTSIRVLNTCFKDKSMIRQDTGTARVTDQPGVLGLKFDRFDSKLELETLESSYIILWTDYQYSIVTDDTREYYYILSRSSTLTSKEIDFFYQKTLDLGFDPCKVIINPDINY